MERRPFVFISMAITPRSNTKNHAIEFCENLFLGREIAVELIRNGFCVYCPSNDFLYFVGDRTPEPEDIYKQDLAIIRRADAVLVISGERTSKNVRREIKFAESYGIPVYRDVPAILRDKERLVRYCITLL